VGILLAGAILVVTLGVVLARPWGLSRAWGAAIGGAAAVVTGLVSPGQAAGLLTEAADPLVLLVGMMSLSAAAEKSGVFGWAASVAVHAGGGSTAHLFGLVFVVGCLTTAVLSLDATAVVLTPIVFGAVSGLGLKPLPFMFACVYAANTASLFLPVSNLTNLLAYNAFGLGFGRYSLVMLLPAILAVLTNILVFGWLFRRDLRGSYEASVLPRFSPETPAFFRLVAGTLLAVLAAFFFAPLIGVPIGLVALTAAVLVVGVARLKGWLGLREAAGGVSWDVLVLVVGLFLVVRAAEGAGLGALAEGAYAAAAPGDGPLGILAVASASALGANLLNNLPTMLLALDALGPLVSAGQLGQSAVYATVVGTGVGPNLTVVGSLATLIWLSVVRGKGVKVTAREYLKVGVVSTPPIVLAAAVGLWVSQQLVGP
jgi:arsenical pump membrane protein